MDAIGERIKKVRQEKHLTQQAFADKICVKRNTVATYEMGRSTPADSAIALICREFHVNETWLRTGEGEMFTSADTSILSQLASQYRLTKEQLYLIENFLTLPDKYREAVVQIARHLANGQESQEAPTYTEPLPQERPHWMTEEEWDDLQRNRTAKDGNSTEAG